MQKILLDTNILIDWLNEGLYGQVLLAREAFKYLSAVVILELEAGTFSKKDQRVIEKLVQNFQAAGRVVVPTVADYQKGGRLLRELQEAKGYDLKKTYTLVNDVLIALCAKRIGATLLTQNAADFSVIQELVDFSFVVPPPD